MSRPDPFAEYEVKPEAPDAFAQYSTTAPATPAVGAPPATLANVPESHLGMNMDVAELWKQLKERTGEVLSGRVASENRILDAIFNTRPNAAIPNVSLLPGAIAGTSAGALVPSAERAAGKFAQIMERAKDIPIDKTLADQVAGRAAVLETRGHTLPKVFSDFMKASEQGEIPYEAGKDFATAAGEKIPPTHATAPSEVMRGQLKDLYGALKQGNRAAAEKVGMGDIYDSAIREYRRAKTIEDAVAVTIKYATRAGLIAAGGYGIGRSAYEAWRTITGR